jgi:predicted nucleic acid-binding protein
MTKMSSSKPLRLFLDSNVILAGFLSLWGLDKAILSLGAARVVRLVIAEVIRREVEENLLLHAVTLSQADSDQLLSDYDRFISLARPEIVPLPSQEEVDRNRAIIHHLPDVPVVLSAMAAQPDWFITNNTAHFDEEVAARTGLRIVTPRQFFGELTLQTRQN